MLAKLKLHFYKFFAITSRNITLLNINVLPHKLNINCQEFSNTSIVSKVSLESWGKKAHQNKRAFVLILLPKENKQNTDSGINGEGAKSDFKNNVEIFDKARMMTVTKKRFFYENAFSIYGGTSGLYDYGPLGTLMIENILAEWNQFFVIQEDMLKLNCSTLSPESLLKASGHVDRFSDIMVKDSVTEENIRLDHLIQNHLQALLKEKLSNQEKQEVQSIISCLNEMTKEEMDQVVTKFDIRNPSTGNPLTKSVAVNLMFPINFGATGTAKGYLRPETSQGLFINFKKLYEWNSKKLPLACAQVGSAFRNEIAPGSSLLRTREFIMAEISHFCYPNDLSHSKFSQLCDTEVWLLSAENQLNNKYPQKLTIKEAIDQGTLSDETMGFYLAKIQLFLLQLGINPRKLRFRQHLKNEMAHYACDCWDAECLTSYGWIECVGLANRGNYDLTQHSKATGTKFSVEQELKTPVTVDDLSPIIDEVSWKKSYKRKDRKALLKELSSMSDEDLTNMDIELSDKGKYITRESFEVTRAMVSGLEVKRRQIFKEDVVPIVIEPSFGIGRILYVLLEQSFKIREDKETRSYFSLVPSVAPIKACVLTLSNDSKFYIMASSIANSLKKKALVVRIDETGGQVGKSYVKWDEMGVPYSITIDFDSMNLSPPTVSLRERDSMEQVRIPVEKVSEVLQNLSLGLNDWPEIRKTWPVFVSQKTIH